ncbi:hypothetical protein EYC84_008395 [Monilinia fructicola]|uniref:Uncharacterized protein n=1 Tax=Monilinia fructicola TaxID=38448 RepID=A0A5M9JF08_MONFR|nr:hypothetical protein EYC84_008395 [Monilinia fructicola]
MSNGWRFLGAGLGFDKVCSVINSNFQSRVESSSFYTAETKQITHIVEGRKICLRIYFRLIPIFHQNSSVRATELSEILVENFRVSFRYSFHVHSYPSLFLSHCSQITPSRQIPIQDFDFSREYRSKHRLTLELAVGE